MFLYSDGLKCQHLAATQCIFSLALSLSVILIIRGVCYAISVIACIIYINQVLCQHSPAICRGFQKSTKSVAQWFYGHINFTQPLAVPQPAGVKQISTCHCAML